MPVFDILGHKSPNMSETRGNEYLKDRNRTSVGFYTISALDITSGLLVLFFQMPFESTLLSGLTCLSIAFGKLL